MTQDRHVGRGIAIVWLMVILSATLTPNPGGAAAAATTPFSCLVCGDLGGVDVLLNVILFIPFAVGLRLAGASFHRTAILSALLTMFVEGMQLHIVPGRDASLSDLLTNTIGGLIGAAVAPHLRSLYMPTRTGARAFAAAWAVVWLAVLAVTAWLLQPWIPDGAFYSGWGVNVPSYRVFDGRVLAAAAGTIPLPPGPVVDGEAIHRRLTADTIALHFDAVIGRPHPRWAPVLALLSHDKVVGAVFDAGTDLVFALPTNAERLRLRNPALRLDAGRPGTPGERVRVTAGVRRRTLWLASSYGGEHRYRELALSPSLGWSMLIPFEYAYGPEVHLLTALWIAGLLLPLGYWTRWAGSSERSRWPLAGGLAALAGLGLALIPRIAGLPPVHRSEWLAAAAGLAAGWAAAGRVAYLAGRCASPSTSESSSS